MISPQAPEAVIMVRPHRFHSNPQTAADNSFQVLQASSPENSATMAKDQFDQAVEDLRQSGVTVHVFDDFGDADTPDSVFPNNWISTHAGGRVAIFPMYTENRRRERRWDIVEMLKANYRVQDVIDYSGLEQDNLVLEGTGAMVLDHIGKIAYTARSNRADPVILERFCTNFNFEPMTFDAVYSDGKAVYHTNVIMAVGTNFAILASEMIPDIDRRNEIIDRLMETGREVVEISAEQVAEFAGNAIELTAGNRNILAISKRAVAALNEDQCRRLESRVELLPIEIPTIETAGGSVRCMIAGIHLAKRQKETIQ
ncbi:MAG: arginine deiminase-related protein [Pseudomonadota bacterium]